jgi:hypothetical protein
LITLRYVALIENMLVTRASFHPAIVACRKNEQNWTRAILGAVGLCKTKGCSRISVKDGGYKMLCEQCNDVEKREGAGLDLKMCDGGRMVVL